jgi:muconolactone delta-isomerase
MEYLVTMTTHVPEGTTDDAVADVRAREATRSAGLAEQGRLLRLWRPPLHPGEWRTLGLFRAQDATELEAALASMPLSIWRADEVTPLASHPHDPGPGKVALGRVGAEFLTTLTVTVPAGTPPEDVADMYSREGKASHELANQGKLLRLWRLPGERRALGHWQARDVEQLDELMATLPLADWWTVETVALARHPNDPAVLTRA